MWYAMGNKWIMMLAVVSVCLTSVAMADDDSGACQVQLDEAIQLHDQLLEGEADITPKALAKKFNRLLDQNPQQPVALAYLGSSYALWARDSTNVTSRTRYANRGIRYIDEAVELAPDNFTVLMVNASVSMELPEMFSRAKVALAHSIRLDQLYTADPKLHEGRTKASDSMILIYDYLQRHAEKAGDSKAAEVWENKKQQAESKQKLHADARYDSGYIGGGCE